MAEKTEFAIRPAGFWIRAGAHAIDQSLLFVALMPIMAVYGFLLGAKVIRQNPYFDIAVLAAIVILVLSYYVVMVWKKGGTLGKLALGLQIEAKDTGHPSLGVALGRYFGQFLSGLLLFAGYIMVGLRSDKKGLHDLICNTQVKRVKAIPIIGILALCVLPISLTVLLGISAAVAAPQFKGMKNAALEGQTRANLAYLRSAVQLFYVENGAFPKSLEGSDFMGSHIQGIPAIKLPQREPSQQVTVYPFSNKLGQFEPSKLHMSGGWAYDPDAGLVVLDIEGKDRSGSDYWTW